MIQKRQKSKPDVQVRGRPPKFGERVPLGLRVTKEVKQRLDEASKASGRSLSQEAELRLEHSFEAQNAVLDALDLAYGRRWTGLLLAIAAVAQVTGTRGLMISRWDFEGCEEWVSDPYAYDQAVRGIHYLLEQFRPKGEPKPTPFARSQFPYLPDESLERLGKDFAKALLSAKQTDRPFVPREISDAIWSRIADLKSPK